MLKTAVPTVGADAPVGVSSARSLPTALAPGATVAVVAPAAPYSNRSDVLRGVEWWQSHGYRVRLDPGLYARDGFFAGTAQRRAAAINAAFADDEVDAIHCLHGGYGSTEVVPLLDYSMIAAHPKPFVGSSDVTVLHLALGKFAGLVTFYGPGLTQVARPGTPALNQDSLLRAVTDAAPLGPCPRNPDDPYLRALGQGQARGETVGGALWVLCMTVGTPWQPDLTGKILLLEEIGEPPWRMDAMLTHLRQSGVLKQVAGVAVGELVDCDWSPEHPETPFVLMLEDVLERQLGSLGVPCVYGFPFGHGRNKVTVPFGIDATLDTDSQTLTFEQAALNVPSPLDAGPREAMGSRS